MWKVFARLSISDISPSRYLKLTTRILELFEMQGVFKSGTRSHVNDSLSDWEISNMVHASYTSEKHEITACRAVLCCTMRVCVFKFGTWSRFWVKKCNIVHMLRDPFEWPCVYFIEKVLDTAVVFQTAESLSSKGQANKNQLSHQS